LSLLHLSLSLSFPSSDFELAEEETCRATIRMFVDFNLTSQFHIPYDVSWRLWLAVKRSGCIVGIVVMCQGLELVKLLYVFEGVESIVS